MRKGEGGSGSGRCQRRRVRRQVHDKCFWPRIMVTDLSLPCCLTQTRAYVQFRRLIQMGIIMYVVLYALMLQKGYQGSAPSRLKVAFSLQPILGTFHWLSTVSLAAA